MFLAYRPEHYQIANAILGREGVDLMTRCPLALATDGRARVDFDETWAVVRHTEDSLENALIVAHELGHLWHVTSYPKLSLEAPVHRCEAVAYLFEGALVQQRPELAAPMRYRLDNFWDSEAKALLDNVPLSGFIQVKDWGHDILAGRYG